MRKVILMRPINCSLGLFTAAILVVLLFVILAPTNTLSNVLNWVGNLIQKIVAWIKGLFS